MAAARPRFVRDERAISKRGEIFRANQQSLSSHLWRRTAVAPPQRPLDAVQRTSDAAELGAAHRRQRGADHADGVLGQGVQVTGGVLVGRHQQRAQLVGRRVQLHHDQRVQHHRVTVHTRDRRRRNTSGQLMKEIVI